MSMTSESDEKMISKNGVDSPSLDDANSGSYARNNGPLKKGPWTTAEDAILLEYVTKHGEGNWNAVQKHSGLARCGKSCRLRWANHLRPDLKKGTFTPEEERRIIELHAKMGNKWARMAAELPGRTDNEIKNFWNTRIKRRQRAGLPLYPPDLCLQPSNDNQQTNDLNTLSPPHPDFMPVTNNFLKIPSVEFKGLGFNHDFHPQSLIDINSAAGPHFLDIPSSSLGLNNLSSNYHHHKSLVSTFHSSKRLRTSESLFPQFYQPNCTVQLSKSFVFPSPYDHHHHSNVYELPSLQTQAGNGAGSISPSSASSSPLPFFESVIQTPPTEHVSSNSGLLEEVLYESETLKNPNANNMGNSISARFYSETKWPEAYDEGLSPLVHSPSSVFSDSNPITPVNGNSLDEPRSAENLPVKEAASNMDLMQYGDKAETTNQMMFSRPDYMLASNCLVPLGPLKHAKTNNDHSLLENAMGKLLGEDLSRDCKQIDTGASSSCQGRGSNCCAWNAMPTV
ncbi:hypothetical protein CASFOL_035191 [Castilleja foliolosa]|uniref:Transcription factor GAMYB n=1 Tax=Castilleja foliolosa TaxID=1961234 RepID=A0ABD3BSN1_9LAMI